MTNGKHGIVLRSRDVTDDSGESCSQCESQVSDTGVAGLGGSEYVKTLANELDTIEK